MLTDASAEAFVVIFKMYLKFLDMNTIRFNEQNVSVFMNYTDLQRMMKECVETTIKEIKNEQKKLQEQKWLDTTHTAQMFGVHVCTINRWKHSGYLTPRTIGGRDFFSIDEINHLLTTQQQSA